MAEHSVSQGESPRLCGLVRTGGEMKSLCALTSADLCRSGGTARFFLFSVLPVLTRGALCGVAVGAVVTVFNRLLTLAADFAVMTAAAARSEEWRSALYILGLFALGVFMHFFLKAFPEGRGSGIPRTESVARGRGNASWWRLAFSTVVGSTLSFFAGLSVGAEGPSVQLGGGIGEGIEDAGDSVLRKRGRRPVMSAGIAAGIACAFVAPLSGILFATEEVQHRFKPVFVATAALAVLYAYAVRTALGGVLGMNEVFIAAEGVGTIGVGFLWTAVVAGIFAALAAKLFGEAVLALDALSRRSPIPRAVLTVGLFVLTGIVGLFASDALGSGANIISGIIVGDFGWRRLAVLLVLKIVLVLMVFRAAPTGGMMVPMLAIGAMLGALIGFVCMNAGLPAECVPALALVTMAAFFGSCIKAPFTVLVMFLETTLLFENFAAAAVAVCVSYAAGILLGQRSMYDVIQERDRRAVSAPVYKRGGVGI